MKYSIIFLLLFACTGPKTDSFYVVTNGHAHNDYEHDQPLINALEAGFISVEADVHLINDSLFVTHDSPKSTHSLPTLTDLYLQPLANWINRHDGCVYPGYNDFFYLMIDLKTNGEQTFPKLQEQLLLFRDYIYTSDLDNTTSKPVKVFISGNRPIDMILNDSLNITSIDGRPDDLNKGFSSEIMPVISKNYRAYFTWDGYGEPQQDEISAVRDLVKKAQEEGKIVRLWGAPDIPEVWGLLLDLGVDWINTDKLIQFREFSLTRSMKYN